MTLVLRTLIGVVTSAVFSVTGDACLEDFDGCGDISCVPYTTCTDLSPAEQQSRNVTHTCSDCLPGYIRTALQYCIGETQNGGAVTAGIN